MVFPSTPVQYQVQYRWSLYARFQCLLYVSSNTDSTSGSKIKGCSLQGFSIHDSKGCSAIASLTSIPVPSPRDYSTNGSKIQGCSSKDSCTQGLRTNSSCTKDCCTKVYSPKESNINSNTEISNTNVYSTKGFRTKEPIQKVLKCSQYQ